MSKMIEQFQAGRRAGTPLFAVKSSDPEATMQSIQACNLETPLIQWDCMRGWVARNDLGRAAIEKALDGEAIEATCHYAEHLELAAGLPFDDEAETATNPILFVLNGHNYLDKPDFVQALWNLRDQFETSLRSVVLLGPDFNLPDELKQDVLILDEPYPTPEELATIVKSLAKEKIGGDLDKAVDALRGLAAYPAKQAVSMALTRKGVNIDSLWDRKRQMVSERKSLTVWKEGNTFDQLGGLDAIKAKGRRIIKGRLPVRVVVWIEEGEKVAGMGKNAGGDMSGTSSDQQATLLTEIVDKGYDGMILDGVPGSGKSEFAKSFGNEAGVLTIRLDLGGSKGEGLVGQAENEIRANLKVIEAIGGKGGAFFIITTNNSQAMDSAMKSRMTKGTWFFDAPDDIEQEAIWNIYFNQYPEVDRNQPRPDSKVWTGREIRACVMTAWQEDVSLIEAGRDIIAVAISDKDEIERMRTWAHQRYNSASDQGTYDRHRVVAKEVKTATKRKVVMAPE